MFIFTGLGISRVSIYEYGKMTMFVVGSGLSRLTKEEFDSANINFSWAIWCYNSMTNLCISLADSILF